MLSGLAKDSSHTHQYAYACLSRKVISGVPLIVRFIESVAHIIATVTVYLQGSRLVSLVIYDINAHHVAVAETVVVDAGYGKLSISPESWMRLLSCCSVLSPKKSSLQPVRSMAPAASRYNKVCFTLFINNSFWGDDLSLEERSSRIISRIEIVCTFYSAVPP